MYLHELIPVVISCVVSKERVLDDNYIQESRIHVSFFTCFMLEFA